MMTITAEAKQAQVNQFTLDATQQQAIDLPVTSSKRVVGVTGAAGTGKTTILQQTYNTLIENGYRVALCSPTGKASKRIYEVTGIEAFTIHRLLEFTHPGEPDPKTGKPVNFSYPKRTRSNPLEYDVYLETSTQWSTTKCTAHCLMRCLRVDQCVCSEITTSYNLSKRISVLQQCLLPLSISLTSSHQLLLIPYTDRGKTAVYCLTCKQSYVARMPTRNDQWQMTFTERPVDVLRETIINGMDDGIDFTTFENQIITPQNTSWVGTQKLNAMIQAMFHNQDGPLCVCTAS
jgi:hypothetical protein